MKKNLFRIIVTIFMLLLIASALPVIAQEEAPGSEPVAHLEITPAGITWQPMLDFDYERIVLSVTGPDGFAQVYEFPAGEQPSLSVVMADGQTLADGAYSYELQAVPLLGAQAKAAFEAAQESHDPAVAEALRAAGLLPADIPTQSGAFSIAAGAVVLPQMDEPAPDLGAQGVEPAAQVYATDLIVQGSECVGVDCGNSENFGFDTIRLKENNLRIKFQDTSNSGSFPTVDWQLTANDSSNGGLNRFSIESIDNGKVPFTVEYGAGNNALYVDDGGRVGFGTNTPVVGLHRVTGNTPTLRLEQNGSSGFTPQTWDVAGNEANFFVRDVTNGSRLVFRLRPGAPTSSIDVAASGNVGLGTASPSASLHVQRSDGTANILVKETSSTSATRTMLEIRNFGPPRFVLANDDSGNEWFYAMNANNHWTANHAGGAQEFLFTTTGSLTMLGTLTTGGPTCSGGCVAAQSTGGQVLDKVAGMPLYAFSDTDASAQLAAQSTAADVTVQHFAPDAAEFNALFGLGSSDGIAPLDVASVAVMAVQELNQVVADQQATIDSQAEQIAELQARLQAIEKLLQNQGVAPPPAN